MVRRTDQYLRATFEAVVGKRRFVTTGASVNTFSIVVNGFSVERQELRAWIRRGWFVEVHSTDARDTLLGRTFKVMEE